MNRLGTAVKAGVSAFSTTGLSTGDITSGEVIEMVITGTTPVSETLLAQRTGALLLNCDWGVDTSPAASPLGEIGWSIVQDAKSSVLYAWADASVTVEFWVF